MPGTDVVLILTRPSSANVALVASLGPVLSDRVTVLHAPLIEIEPVADPIEITAEECAIFTSANAVPFVPDGQGRRAFCVGQATAAAAKRFGWDAQAMGQDGAELVTALRANPPLAPLVHVHGTHMRVDIAAELAANGQTARSVRAYDQTPKDLTTDARAALLGVRPVVVPLFSPRTAQLFSQQADATAPLYLAAMSKAVVDALGDTSARKLRTAHAPTLEQMVISIEKLLSEAALG